VTRADPIPFPLPPVTATRHGGAEGEAGSPQDRAGSPFPKSAAPPADADSCTVEILDGDRKEMTP